MGDSVNIRGLAASIGQLRRIEEFLESAEPMQKLVEEVKRIILRKTARGVDYMGKKFKPYSEAYAKRKGVSAGSVDLRRTGEMLDSILTEVLSPHHGRVSVKGRMELIAYFHNMGTAGGKIPQRMFMNLSDTAKRDLLKKYFDDEIMKILGRG